MLNLDSFSSALTSLEIVLQEPVTDIVRDSAIQRFEYTYELSMKMLKRYLEMSEFMHPAVDEMSFKDLLRLGAEKGCVKSPNKWFDYREMRNITSHAYDKKKAVKIYKILPAFTKDARFLLNELKQRANSV